MKMPGKNYAKELDSLIESFSREGRVPTLLLHACCAPCSSYVLEYLSRYFSISVLYYNPNIAPKEEYDKRRAELERLISAMHFEHPVTLLPCKYEGEAFEEIAAGYEDCPEGGERCMRCFRLRLEKTAEEAKKGGFDYFTTTLSISPLKNCAALNRIGEEAGEKLGVPHLPGDFKKHDGYKRSLELSREYDLYRQDYCGCAFSREERRRQKERKDCDGSGA